MSRTFGASSGYLAIVLFYHTFRAMLYYSRGGSGVDLSSCAFAWSSIVIIATAVNAAYLPVLSIHPFCFLH